MKQFYLFAGKAVLAVMLLSTSFTANAQVLSAGDIAFTGYVSTANAPASDAFSFVLLVNIPAGTVIRFTENAWGNDGVFRTGENTVSWTSGSALVAGREITISGPPSGTATALVSGSSINAGTCTGTMPSLSLNGDQVIAYQSTTAGVAPFTFISAIHMNVYNGSPDPSVTDATNWDNLAAASQTTNSSFKPTGLTTGTNAIWIGTQGSTASERNNARYNCSGALATPAQVRASVNNQANWNTEFAASGATPTWPLPSGCAFLASIFPLDIISFTGNNNNTSIGLNWQSANEPNDRGHFEIEKSVDGVTFTRIGQVNNQGFSYLPNNYAFADNSPVNGANFYRLKIVSDNGMVKYSSVVKVLFGKTGRGVMISPNPAVTEFTVSARGSSYTNLVITDRSGRAVLQQRLSGNNNTIDVSRLPAGQYSVTLFGAAEKTTEKLLIVH